MSGESRSENAPVSVAAAEVIRNFGHWQQQALEKPLTITHHGRARVMLISTETYERLRRMQSAPQAVSSDVEVLIDSMAEGFMQMDRELRIVNMNRVAEAYFGRRLSDVKGASFADPRIAAANDTVHKMSQSVLTSREMVSYQIDSTVHLGRRLLVRTFPFGDGIASLFVNITEQERLRRDAENARALKSALGALRRVAVLCLNVHGHLQSADDALTELTGFTFEDLRPMRLLDCVAPADRRRAEAVYGELVASAKAGVVTVRVTVKSGEERLLKLAFVPVIRDAAQTGAMLLISDAAPA